MKYNVLYAADDKYATYCGVSICSLIENSKREEELEIYILLDHVSKKNIELFDELEKQNDRLTIHKINCDNYKKKLDNINKALSYRGSYAATLRLFFLEFIDDEVEKLLYLDSDTLVLDSLDELFATDLVNSPIAAVNDALGGYYKLGIGFNKEDIYFNSGVLLFDVKNWKLLGCQSEIEKLLSTNITVNPDQDILNKVFKETKLILSPKYNFQPVHEVYSDEDYFSIYPYSGYYTKEEISVAKSKPIILHCYRFLGQFPWHENSMHPDKDLFYEYLNKTPWKDTFKPVKNSSLVFKVERLLFKIMPHWMFIKMFKYIQNAYFKMEGKLKGRKM